MTLMANGVNKNLPIPVRNTIGKNTLLIVTVTMVSGRVTSLAPSRAESNEDLPVAKWRYSDKTFGFCAVSSYNNRIDWWQNSPLFALEQGYAISKPGGRKSIQTGAHHSSEHTSASLQAQQRF